MGLCDAIPFQFLLSSRVLRLERYGGAGVAAPADLSARPDECSTTGGIGRAGRPATGAFRSRTVRIRAARAALRGAGRKGEAGVAGSRHGRGLAGPAPDARSGHLPEYDALGLVLPAHRRTRRLARPAARHGAEAGRPG